MACGLFNLMEDFILREVDYSQQYGYSSRAKRYMRRKLNKELAPYLDDESESETEPDESLILSNRRLEICIGVGYICFVVTFYSAIMYITQAYSHEKTCK
jgi:hypothetical protein